MEALVVQEQWKPLFTDEERQAALDRLSAYGYDPSSGSETALARWWDVLDSSLRFGMTEGRFGMTVGVWQPGILIRGGSHAARSAGHRTRAGHRAPATPRPSWRS